jgi:hypothetical protein
MRMPFLRHLPIVRPSARLLVAAALLGAAPPATADSDPGGFPHVSVGIKGGLGLAQHQGTMPRDSDYAVASDFRSGLAAGVVLTLPVTSRLLLQQEVLYVQKGSRQDVGVEIFEIPTVLHVSYDMDYLEIPVLLRYQWRIDRGLDIYSLAGFGFALRLHDRYRLSGEVSDGEETIPLRADSDMSEVDPFDFLFTYGIGLELPRGARRLLLEYRFDLSLQQLPLPTYADVPLGGETVRVNNDPVPLRNQCHMLLIGVRF